MPRKKRSVSSSAPPRAIQKQEIIRCGKDQSYFLNKYVKISHPKKGSIPFHTFDYQDSCMEEYNNNQFVIINKSRQLGLSTISAGYALWLGVFHKEKNVLIIATKLGIAQNFMKKVFGMFDSLPSWLVMPSVTARTKTQLTFSNGSEIKAVPTSIDAGRSEALSLLIIDEAAHVENIDDLWLGLQPTLSTGGRAVLISTPNGVGNLFHRLWTGAQDGTNEFKWIEIPWTAHPERDQEWYDSQVKNIMQAKGERGVAQELLCSFNASGDTFLKSTYMEMMERKTRDPIAHHPNNDDIWIWEYAQSNHQYLISADISRGDAQDFSTAHVIDTTTDKVVCEYKGKIPPDKFSALLIDLGQKYNNALICPELNSYGLITSQKLKDSGYQNLFYEKKHRNLYMTYQDQNVGDDLPGFTTGPKSRGEIIAKLENVLRNGNIELPSKRLLSELKTFIWKNNKAQAMKGYNDDLVMALAIGISLYETAGKSVYSGDDYAQAMLAGMSTRSSTMQTGLGDAWGVQSNDANVPPIMTTNNRWAQERPIANPHLGQSNVQDYNNPFWRQWAWVTDD